MKQIIQKLKHYFFAPRWQLNRFQFNLMAVVLIGLGVVLGGFLTVKNVLLPIFAFNDTTNTWNINVGTSNAFTFDTNLVTVGGSGAQPISTVNKIANPSFEVGTSSWSVSAVAPAGWVEVPGSTGIGTSNFLVMKYEAKCAGVGNTGVGLTAPADTTYKVYQENNVAGNLCTAANSRVVTSLASGYPIAYINQTEANTRCNSITIGSTSTHLMFDREWMTVARDAEATGTNWSTGNVGSGGMYGGHMDNNPATALEASTDDSLGWTGTNDSSGDVFEVPFNTTIGAADGKEQRRTFTLSNGAVVWDISGNVWEWTNNIQVTNVDTTAGWVDWNHANIAAGARILYGSTSYLSAQGTGQVYGGAINNGFLRGGYWNDGAGAGAFALYLNNLPSGRSNYVGFRCASDPVAIYQSFSSSSGRGAAGGNLVTVGSIADAKIVQSVNVGNTATYDFSAYVYDNTASNIGGTVTSSIAQLYYNGVGIGATYINAGSGWWKLSTAVTGANAARDFGVLVKAGKTVVADDFTLARAGTYSIYTTNAYQNTNVSSWDSFAAVEVGVTGNAGVHYQICLDDGSACGYTSGSRWQYYDIGGSWANATEATTTYANTAAQLTTTAMQKLSITSKKISVKVIFTFGGVDMPAVTSFTVGLTTDITAPGNISAISMKKNVSAGSTLAANSWTNDSGPYFSWNQAVDNVGGVGIKGYCIYLSNGDTSPDLRTYTSSLLPGNTSLDSVHISSANTQCGNGSGFLVSTENINFATVSYRGASWLTTSATPYYIYIKAVDNAGNIADDPNVSFYFRFDNTPPTNPSYISLPGDYISTKAATFLWASSGADGPKDEGQSGVTGLQYRIGVGGTWYGSNHTGTEGMDDLLVNNGNYTTVADPDYASIVEGSNIVYLRTWDVAGNVTTSYVSSALKVNTISPSKPTNLSVGPTDSTTNSYAFTWEDPVSITGQAANLTFCYSINTLPTAIACSFTAAGVHSLAADAFATQPGVNTFYLAARDEAGNISYDNYESVAFTYSGSAPGIPRNVDVADISIKATSNWKLAVSWDAPTSLGAGIASYKIYRSITAATCSTDMSTFSLQGSTAGTSYSDTGLAQKTYYYCIKACDSANNCSAVSSTVGKYPTGKYFTAASLTSGPTVSSITTKKAVISWSTDRGSDSKVSYGVKTNNYYTEEPSNSSQVTDHTITLNNLTPGTTYYYKTKWTDGDGNTGTSEEKSFTTAAAPTVKDVSVKSIGLVSAIVQYTSKDASKVKIYYGKTTGFGGIKETATATSETIYTSELSALDDGTKYYYKINTFDSDGSEYEGTTLDFTTLPRPRISTVRLQQVANTAQSTILVSWNTNTEVSSIVTYWPQNDLSAARDEVSVALTKGEHKIIVRGLLPNVDYTLQVKGRDKIGNEATSEVQHFTTAEDTRPPQMAGVWVEGQTVPPVAQTAQEPSAQMIVTWNTDEPASSQVEFGEGTGTNYSQKTQEDEKLTLNHLVIISNLSPSRVYHLRALSKDKAQNLGQSVDTVMITPKATDNALNLVITNLGEVFDFMGWINR